MPEEVLFESEEMRTRDEVASYLRTLADRLDAGDPVSLESGADGVTVDPPSTVEFEVKVEREGASDAPGELSIEVELEWDESQTGDADGTDGLTIG